jgi:hypothetical protein
MRLTLDRLDLKPGVTIGRMAVDGASLFFTLEDEVRPAGVKVPGKTAIPAGVYSVKLTVSPRFGVLMPLLVDVPNFEGIRIHWGNYPEDTDGCILVGMERGSGAILRSRVAYAELMKRLAPAHAAGADMSIEVRQ